MPDARTTVPQETGQRLASTLKGTLSPLVSQVDVTFREARSAEALAALPGPIAALTFGLARGAEGPAALVLPGSAGLALARAMLGGEGGSGAETPGAEEEDALRELANQVASGMATSLGALLGSPVGFETPAAEWHATGGAELKTAADSVALVLGITIGSQAADLFLVLPRGALGAAPSSPREASLPAPKDEPPGRNGNGLEILLDITLPVSVELGRTKMMIRDILHLAPGSILELDKLAGEPVDIMINDKSIARGEVVVIDENFGVRLTSILSPSERVMNLR